MQDLLNQYYFNLKLTFKIATEIHRLLHLRAPLGVAGLLRSAASHTDAPCLFGAHILVD